MFAAPFSVACSAGLFIWFLMTRAEVANMFSVLVSSMIAVWFMWIAFRNLEPIEMVTFKNRSGIPIFDIIKNRSDGDEFEDFVAKFTAILKMNIWEVDRTSQP
jgi:hypothetical protein